MSDDLNPHDDLDLDDEDIDDEDIDDETGESDPDWFPLPAALAEVLDDDAESEDAEADS